MASALMSSDDAFGADVAEIGDAGAEAAAVPASATVTETGTGLPAAFSATDCSHAFCSSHWLFAFFWFGRNVNVTPAGDASIRNAEATTRL